jgi:hypothetical protein
MSDYRFQKHFTLAEARALLPELRQLFRDIHRRRDAVRQADEKLRQQLTQTGGDLGGKMVTGLLLDLLQLNRQLRHLQALGILVKDFDRGLVDFPHLREGREVFLCWELDEDDIEFWHDVDAGYAGRERL